MLKKIHRLYERNSSLCFIKNPFGLEGTLASGKKSDFYVDARQSTLHHEGSFLIATLILDELSLIMVAMGDYIAGAIPISGSTTLLSSKQDPKYSWIYGS